VLGYEVDFSFLSEDVQKIISHNVSDKLISHIAHRTVIHPELSNLYVVGLYRGPYFGIMELQARWAAGLLSGSVQKPTLMQSEAGLDRESEIRARTPRP
jgi:dimethylaniline monooxygenase (N-oxide forming)